MHVILTHEQADFDALGAALAAYLLNDRALLVAPRRMNRNGRAFLALYGADLPFLDPRDLPSEPIESVLLVDTQSLITLKGLGTQTRVQVIDHHQPRPDLPSAWQVTLDFTGACTTLLVESLQERAYDLSMIQATLLLLGIYEDTGSLTYLSTTARDVRAAAYLLEQGANLRILAGYLNPPLSGEQRRIYEQLLANAETHTIQGETIVIAQTDGAEMGDEISTVAHKLRDLLDPDALFILVSTREGVRLVARSTSDQINVALITAEFNGGGHERAAAALVHTPEDGEPGESATVLEDTYQKLISVLPRYVRPAVTVSQIMSRRPYLLSPDTSVQDAAQVMQRYGYEGFPVVDNGKVVGLLTRRSVDRAIAHKLNLKAANLMEVGQVTVEPGCSLEQLQNVMATSGWGQVPVVDPANGEILGIVTRTDVLKTLAPRASLPSSQNYAAILEAALPLVRLALLRVVASRAHDRHMAVYIVGGFVRDLLLERPSLDFDLVVEGEAITLGKALAAEFGGRLALHSRFGTAKWHIHEIRPQLAARLDGRGPFNPDDLPEFLDLISARTEFYDHPTALPTVERGNIKLDLHRRDFTINTLALRLDGRHYGELHDYWGGLKDLHQGLVRVLHSLSFIDDPTRLLRAVRFEQRFSFKIEDRTLQLMGEALSMFKQVSGDRLRHELDLILVETRAARMLERLNSLGILPAIHPDLFWQAEIAGRLPKGPLEELAPGWDLPATQGGVPAKKALAYLVWLVCLPPASATSIAQRLKLPASLVNSIQAACQLWIDLPSLAGASPSQLVERLDPLPLLSVYAVYCSSTAGDLRRQLFDYGTRLRTIFPITDGNTLRARGLPPSPIYRPILQALRTAWLDGIIHTPEEEQALLEQLLANPGSSG